MLPMLPLPLEKQRTLLKVELQKQLQVAEGRFRGLGGGDLRVCL